MLELEMKIRKARSLRGLIMILGVFFIPIWILNIGSKKRIEDMEKELEIKKLG